jgi:hypothetical protein
MVRTCGKSVRRKKREKKCLGIPREKRPVEKTKKEMVRRR